MVVFDTGSRTLVPLQPITDPEPITRKVRSIRADGGTNLGPALRRAHDMLKGVEARRKHVVCLSDGQSMHPDRLEGIVRQMNGDDITVTTIAVGDEAVVDVDAVLTQQGRRARTAEVDVVGMGDDEERAGRERFLLAVGADERCGEVGHGAPDLRNRAACRR